jgi:hypothetical protein
VPGFEDRFEPIAEPPAGSRAFELPRDRGWQAMALRYRVQATERLPIYCSIWVLWLEDRIDRSFMEKYR